MIISEQMKKAVLLVNLGTPDNPDRKSIRKYLRQFLNDPFVIDMPRLARLLLVNLIIIPFRVSKSTKLYQRLWTKAGSPISIHLEALRTKLQELLGSEQVVYAAMRYGKPALRSILTEIDKAGFEALHIIPLFPQYASSTTGSIINTVQKHKKKLQNIKRIEFTKQFYDHPGFIKAFCKRIISYHPETFDHILFSCHSLPERHVQATHPEHPCAQCTCENQMPAYGNECYKATSYATARLIADSLHLKPVNYTVAFQSRFAKKWIGPFTEDVVVQLAHEGKSRILVVAPSFVADCLETLVEIGQDYRELFIRHGGKELVMCESLNAEEDWVEAVEMLVEMR
jgi:protoporphyrin/coproporphyrin ferrochelatase